MKKIILTSILFSASLLAAPKYTDWAVPSNLHIYSEAGNAYVKHLPGKCTTSVYKLKSTHSKFDAIFGLLLTAQTANKRVVIRYDGCLEGGKRGKIVGVYLKD